MNPVGEVILARKHWKRSQDGKKLVLVRVLVALVPNAPLKVTYFLDLPLRECMCACVCSVEEVIHALSGVACIMKMPLLPLQEEGWLTGVKEGTNEKGLFPANFTRPM